MDIHGLQHPGVERGLAVACGGTEHQGGRCGFHDVDTIEVSGFSARTGNHQRNRCLGGDQAADGKHHVLIQHGRASTGGPQHRL